MAKDISNIEEADEIETTLSCTHEAIIEVDNCLICEDCGEVVQENYLVNTTNPVYNYDDVLKKVNYAPLDDLYRQKLSSVNPSKKMHRLDNLNKSTITAKQKKIRDLIDISRGCIAELGIEKDSVLWQEIEKLINKCGDYKIRGRSKEELLAALFFLAHKRQEIPKSFKKLLVYFDVKSKSVWRIIDDLNKKKIIEREQNAPLMNHYTDVMNKLFDDLLEIDFSLLVEGNRIANRIDYNLNRNFNPYTAISGIIYYLVKFKKIKMKQLEIANRLGVSDCSLRSWYKFILQLIFEN
jgi:transcription initiation factor TFIIIB Brf1 subunit/transcription initiation factor TFIIB